MFKFLSRFIFVTFLLIAIFSTPTISFARPSAEVDQAILQTDKTFIKALEKTDKATVTAMLDADFTWTDVDGKTLTSSDLAQNTPSPVLGSDSAIDVKEVTYGDVGAVTANRGKLYVFRVWVKRSAGWKILVYHEVKQLDQPSTSSGTGVKICENPCKTVPFEPKNPDEQAIIASWQGLETGVTAHDSAAWAPHIADEFLQISSNSDHPISKSGRMAILDKQKINDVGSAPAPLVSAKMYDFGDAVVMTCLHQPYTGKAVHVSRVWIKRDGQWMMSRSFQTAIQSSAVKN